MSSYFTVFIKPAVEDRARKIKKLIKRRGDIDTDRDALSARELGPAVAESILSFNRQIGFPTTLAEIAGIGRVVVEKILTAAKDPQLGSKMQNLPVPLIADLVDQYMGPVLEAAWSGALTKIAIRE